MKRTAQVAGIAIVVVLIGALSRATAGLDGLEFTRDVFGWRIAMTAPNNWEPSEERTYPSILLWMIRRDPPGKMLLSAERLSDEKMSAEAYALETTKLLENMGFTVRSPQLHSSTGAFWIDFDNGAVYLRQAFLVRGGIGYALTLSARDSRTRGQHLRAFDGALRSIRVKRAARAAPAPDAGPQPTPKPTP